MKERGWEDRELDYARQVMVQASNEQPFWRKVIDQSLLWLFLVIIGVGNLFIIASIMPLLVLFPNAAIYGILMLLGIVVGMLTEIVLRDIEHLFSGHHLYIMYVLVPFIAASGGLVVLTYAQQNLPNFFFLDRDPLKMSIIYTFFFILPLAISKFLRRKKKSAIRSSVDGSNTLSAKKEVL